MMNRKRKRLLLLFAGLMLVIVLVVLGRNYLPVGKLLHRSPSPEIELAGLPGQRIQAPNALYYDLEADPKGPVPSGLYKGIAHSGQFSSKVFGKNSYSFSIERKAREIGPENLGAVAVSAWVYIFPTKSEVTSSLVFSMTNELGVTVTWKGVTVSGKELPMGKWFKVSGLFDLAGLPVKPDNKIQVYYWNNSATDILVDDFYIVFGKPPDRKGDSAIVDMTRKQPFEPKANTPPYPFFFLQKEEAGNKDAAWLVAEGQHKIGLYDKILTGNFTGTTGRRDQLLVMDPSRKPDLYSYCSESRTFVRNALSVDPALLPLMKAEWAIPGRFTGQERSEILLFTGKECLLAGLARSGDPCTQGGKEIPLNVISRKVPFTFSGDPATIKILAFDADGDGITELIEIDGAGNWFLWKYSGEGWKSLANGAGNPVPEWNLADAAVSVNAGRFLAHNAGDLLLTVKQDRKSRISSYSLRRYDPSGKKFTALTGTGDSPFGGMTGLDSLKAGDLFYTGNFGENGVFLRYNRDWRYDLKSFVFRDRDYRILANIDFSGFTPGRNPKYYGLLRLIPGNFISGDRTCLLVIGRNGKKWDPVTGKCLEYEEIPSLPSTIQLYSFPSPEKK
jgi:hypothetical protein